MLEPLLIFGLIVAYIWKLRFLYPISWIAIPVLMLLSHVLRRERPGTLGFRVDHLAEHMKKFAPLLMLIVLVLAAGGAWFHSFRRIGFEDILLSLAVYLPWGLAQEYALNGYFLNRFDAVLSSRAASILTAVLFCAAHAPNYFLMAVTLPLAWLATIVYRQTRNLYVLGIAHAIIGLMLFLVVPDSVSHHLRVGPGWFTYKDVHRSKLCGARSLACRVEIRLDSFNPAVDTTVDAARLEARATPGLIGLRRLRDFHDIDLRGPGPVAGEGNFSLVGRP